MPPRNFSWFVEGRLAALGFPSTRADIEFLCSRGVKRLISLTESPPSLHGFPLTHVHIPIVDFTPPSIEQVNEFLSAVETCNSKEEVRVWLFNRLATRRPAANGRKQNMDRGPWTTPNFQKETAPGKMKIYGKHRLIFFHQYTLITNLCS